MLVEDQRGIVSPPYSFSPWSEANLEALHAASGYDSTLADERLEESRQYWEDV